uniref:Glycosyl hydrolase family 38 C-terminal domain-containing protein n=1 Tax=Oryza nivara TaxID=4536 RepID=A0A0E0IPD9_ORYNI
MARGNADGGCTGGEMTRDDDRSKEKEREEDEEVERLKELWLSLMEQEQLLQLLLAELDDLWEPDATARELEQPAAAVEARLLELKVASLQEENHRLEEAQASELNDVRTKLARTKEKLWELRARVDLPIQQSFLWYASSTGDSEDSQASGAYIFRPNRTTPTIVSGMAPLKVIHGPLVDEVHQQFSSWIYQVTRLYKNKEHAEVEYTIGPIPVDDDDDIGKEVVTRLTTNMATNKIFYTDSNGRDFLERVRNHRDDWDLNLTQPVAGNYYPVNQGIYVADGKYELSVLVDHAVGASSIQDGQIEVMLHRRLSADDGRGVGEPLNEVVCVDQKCDGLVARATYYINVNKKGHGAHWRRTYSQQSLDDGTTLLRLAHLFQAQEDTQYSVMAKVELRKLFGKRIIKDLTETSLSANQKKSEMKKLNWRVTGESKTDPAPLKGGPVDSHALVVELGPMEIRTFLLKF